MEENCDQIGLKELKQRARLYYGSCGDAAGLVDRMEDILNSTFYDNPKDVYGHVGKYFTSFAKAPVITKLCSREVPDSRGIPTVQVEVFCQIAGCEELSASFVSSSSCNLELSNPDEREMVESEYTKSVEIAVELIAGDVSQLVQGQLPSKQKDIDDCLTEKFTSLQPAEEPLAHVIDATQVVEEAPAADSAKGKGKTAPPAKKADKSKGPAVVILPDEPAEHLPVGCEAVSAVSQAVCKSAAHLSQLPLYEHIMQCRQDEEKAEQFRLPLPIVTIMSCGRAGSGKLRCIKEFMVIPSPQMPLSKAVKYLTQIYSHCAKSLAGKVSVPSSARCSNDFGALCPQFERPEQGIDLLQEAITSVGLVSGTDFHLAINCGGREFFDYDKGKYEVSTGQLKSGEEVSKFWSELVAKYPALILLIDPMRKQDKESWMQLTETVSSRCYVAGDYAYHRPGRLLHEDLPADFKTSAMLVYLHQLNTVSDVLACTKKMEEVGCQTIISCSPGETTDTFISDLAVGCNVKFLKVGGLCRGERIAKINRLLEIECQLDTKGKLDRWSGHTFSQIKLPIVEHVDSKTGDPASPSKLPSGLSPSPDKKTTSKSK